MRTRSNKSRWTENRQMMLVTIVGLLYAGFFVLRYGGLWTENDTSIFSYTTRELLKAGTIFFPGEYVHGFAYPAWLGSLSLLTGLPPYVTNTIVMPFVGMLLLTTSAYVAYRTIFRSRRLAVWALVLLFADPDLMFSVLRGNHEKINIAVLLWLVVALFRGFRSATGRSREPLALWVLLFYTFTFLNATANDYFASTLTVGLFIVATWVLLASRIRTKDQTDLSSVGRRLWLVTGVSWLLILWVMFFVFPSAGKDFALVGQAWQKVIELFLSLHGASNPYSAVTQQWAGPWVTVVVESFRWVLFVVSFVGWMAITLMWLFRRREMTFRRHFLLALYGGLGFLIAVSIPVDFSGLAAGSNLELRNFTYFSLVASPMFLLSLLYIRNLAHRLLPTWNVRRIVHLLKPVGAIALCAFFVISLMKTTVDPLISNIWDVYTPYEAQGMEYFLTRAAAYELLWGGQTNRLSLASGGRLEPNPWRVTSGSPNQPGVTLVYLNSPYVDAYSVLERSPVPQFSAMNQVYDNGSVQLYLRKPLTPFEQ